MDAGHSFLAEHEERRGPFELHSTILSWGMRAGDIGSEVKALSRACYSDDAFQQRLSVKHVLSFD